MLFRSAFLPTCCRTVASIVVLHQLADLLFERHLAQQLVDAFFDLGVGELRVGTARALGRRPMRRHRLGSLRRANRCPRNKPGTEYRTGKSGSDRNARSSFFRAAASRSHAAEWPVPRAKATQQTAAMARWESKILQETAKKRCHQVSSIAGFHSGVPPRHGLGRGRGREMSPVIRMRKIERRRGRAGAPIAFPEQRQFASQPRAQSFALKNFCTTRDCTQSTARRGVVRLIGLTSDHPVDQICLCTNDCATCAPGSLQLRGKAAVGLCPHGFAMRQKPRRNLRFDRDCGPEMSLLPGRRVETADAFFKFKFLPDDKTG